MACLLMIANKGRMCKAIGKILELQYSPTICLHFTSIALNEDVLQEDLDFSWFLNAPVIPQQREHTDVLEGSRVLTAADKPGICNISPSLLVILFLKTLKLGIDQVSLWLKVFVFVSNIYFQNGYPSIFIVTIFLLNRIISVIQHFLVVFTSAVTDSIATSFLMKNNSWII